MKASIIVSVNEAILQIQSYVTKYNLSNENTLVKDFLRVLSLIKEELQTKDDVNERLLRGFKDICTTTAIQYEHTSFNDPIFDINDKLEKYVSNYTQLELLRMDFGKGNPI